jgi:benzil reductase ((S)-benzoin forming)
MDKLLSIGSGIVQAYLANGYQVISISRTKNNHPSFANITQINFDLGDSIGAAKTIANILLTINSTTLNRLVLINNAGTLGEINTIEKIEPTDIQHTINLNTVTPLTLTATFIQHTQQWQCVKKVINISSGAAYKPYYGWTVYCASKAAIDMMTQTIALEQNERAYPVQIMAIYPGVVDTNMQAQIRQSDQNSFKELQRFLDLKANHALANEVTVGQQILETDHQDLPNGTLLRLATN